MGLVSEKDEDPLCQHFEQFFTQSLAMFLETYSQKTTWSIAKLSKFENILINLLYFGSYACCICIQ